MILIKKISFFLLNFLFVGIYTYAYSVKFNIEGPEELLRYSSMAVWINASSSKGQKYSLEFTKKELQAEVTSKFLQISEDESIKECNFSWLIYKPYNKKLFLPNNQPLTIRQSCEANGADFKIVFPYNFVTYNITVQDSALNNRGARTLIGNMNFVEQSASWNWRYDLNTGGFQQQLQVVYIDKNPPDKLLKLYWYSRNSSPHITILSIKDPEIVID